jgi:hypothetical protein
MKYYVTVTIKNGSEYTELETPDQTAAINAARNAWRYLTPKERKEQTVEVREFSSKEFYKNDGSCYELIDWDDYSAITYAVARFNRYEGAWAHAKYDSKALTITTTPIHPNATTVNPVTELEKYLPNGTHYAINPAKNKIYIAKF